MQDLTLLPVFATPLAVYNLGSTVKELNKQLVKDIDTEIVGQPVNRTFYGGKQTRLGIEDSFSSFKELQAILKPVYFSMMARYGAPREVMERTILHNLWGNVITDIGGFSEPHTHGTGNTFFTGVYYPAGNEDEDLEQFDYNDYIVSYETSKQNGMDIEGCLQFRSPGSLEKKIIRPDFKYDHTTLFEIWTNYFFL